MDAKKCDMCEKTSTASSRWFKLSRRYPIRVRVDLCSVECTSTS